MSSPHFVTDTVHQNEKVVEMRIDEKIVQQLLAAVSYCKRAVATVVIGIIVYMGPVAGPGKVAGEYLTGQEVGVAAAAEYNAKGYAVPDLSGAIKYDPKSALSLTLSGLFTIVSSILTIASCFSSDAAKKS